MKTLLALSLLFTIGFSSCHSDPSALRFSGDGDIAFSNLEAAQVDNSFPAVEEEPIAGFDHQRKIMRDGNLSFGTDRPEATLSHLRKITAELNGFIASENQITTENGKRITIQIKVPTQNFDSLVASISDFAGELEEKEIRSRDVTEEFLDLEARIRNKKDIEKRYVAILEKSGSIKDVLAVEAEIGKVREEIERMQGKLNYLADRTALSTLSVIYYPKEDKIMIGEASFLAKMKAGFMNGIELILGFFIVLSNIWPLVLAGIILWPIYQKRKKRSAAEA